MYRYTRSTSIVVTIKQQRFAFTFSHRSSQEKKNNISCYIKITDSCKLPLKLSLSWKFHWTVDYLIDKYDTHYSFIVSFFLFPIWDALIDYVFVIEMVQIVPLRISPIDQFHLAPFSKSTRKNTLSSFLHRQYEKNYDFYYACLAKFHTHHQEFQWTLLEILSIITLLG